MCPGLHFARARSSWGGCEGDQRTVRQVAKTGYTMVKVRDGWNRGKPAAVVQPVADHSFATLVLQPQS